MERNFCECAKLEFSDEFCQKERLNTTDNAQLSLLLASRLHSKWTLLDNTIYDLWLHVFMGYITWYERSNNEVFPKSGNESVFSFYQVFLEKMVVLTVEIGVI